MSKETWDELMKLGVASALGRAKDFPVGTTLQEAMPVLIEDFEEAKAQAFPGWDGTPDFLDGGHLDETVYVGVLQRDRYSGDPKHLYGWYAVVPNKYKVVQ